MAKELQLSKTFSIPVNDYANQGNAVLGIRGAGKTYTAMKAAEELLENNIPIVVYDPIGVWKNLKIGTGKHKGYSIVVAGGEGADINLTKENAMDLIRAAMRENISIIFDLYAPELSNKSTWIKIVQETVDVLMNENKSYGLRHVFLEEAAEFIPQRLQPQHSRVYSSLERMARMGRNAGLGLTLINQRAEEVNKAILEICECTLLHKQVGKNSLRSIQQWLDYRQLEKVPEIIKSLPGLEQGECWVIGLSDQPKLIKVAERNTYHPDPKKAKDIGTLKMAVDVSSFVSKMTELLSKPVKQLPSKQRDNPSLVNNEIASLKLELSLEKSAMREMNNHLESLKKVIRNYEAKFKKVLEVIGQPTTYLIGEVQSMPTPRINIALPEIKPAKKITSPTLSTSGYKPSKCAGAIASFLAMYPHRSFSKVQAGVATGYSQGSGGFNNALSELNSNGIIIRDGGKIRINESADLSGLPSYEIGQHPSETFASKLDKCEREIYEVLLKYPHDTFNKQTLAERTPSNYSPGSGGFNNALSRLNTLELIKRDSGTIRLNPEILDI